MQLFVNECSYTDEVIEEAVKAWWDWKVKKQKILFIVILAVFAVYGIVAKNPFFLIPAILSVVGLILIQVKVNNAIKLEKERVKVLSPDGPVLYKLVLGEQLVITLKDSTRSVSLDNIEGFAETKNLVVLFVKGMMTIPFDKSRFSSGNAEQLMNVLKNRNN